MENTYKVKICDYEQYFKGAYFTSDSGIDYFILFEQDGNTDISFFDNDTEIKDKIYQFTFFPNVDINNLPRQDKLNIARDPKIANTVKLVLEKFMQTYGKQHAVFYYCQNEDKKEKGRATLFKRWFEQSSFHHDIIRHDESINARGDLIKENYNWHNTLFVHKDNPLKEKIVAAYKRINYHITSYQELNKIVFQEKDAGIKLGM